MGCKYDVFGVKKPLHQLNYPHCLLCAAPETFPQGQDLLNENPSQVLDISLDDQTITLPDYYRANPEPNSIRQATPSPQSSLAPTDEMRNTAAMDTMYDEELFVDEVCPSAQSFVWTLM